MFQNEIEDWNRTVWRVLLKFILLHIHYVAPKNTKQFKIADKFIWIILRKATLLDNNHALLSVKKLNQRYLFNRDYDVQKTAFKALIKRLSPTAWTMPIRTFTYNYTNIFTIVHTQTLAKICGAGGHCTSFFFCWLITTQTAREDQRNWRTFHANG